MRVRVGVGVGVGVGVRVRGSEEYTRRWLSRRRPCESNGGGRFGGDVEQVASSAVAYHASRQHAHLHACIRTQSRTSPLGRQRRKALQQWECENEHLAEMLRKEGKEPEGKDSEATPREKKPAQPAKKEKVRW